MNSIDIVTNNEEIGFEKFISRLLELHRDCKREHYLSEIFTPFFRMCCDDGVKIVPVYDDRNCGPKAKKPTESNNRMKTICAGVEGGYVVPDYIFVPEKYSFDNPQKPYLMVEIKKPFLIINENEMRYHMLSDFIEKNEKELLAEINACKYVVFTDGIMWMFLEKSGDKIIESEDYPSIKLVNFHELHRKSKTYRISIREDKKTTDLSSIGLGMLEVKCEPPEWGQLKSQIKKIVKDLSGL